MIHVYFLIDFSNAKCVKSHKVCEQNHKLIGRLYKKSVNQFFRY